MRQESKHFYEFGPFRLDAPERQLFRDGKPVELTPKAFDTLVALVENRGHLLTKDDLLKRVWPDTFVEEATLAKNVFTLRKALGSPPGEDEYIETVPTRGYRFVGQVREIADGSPALPPRKTRDSPSTVSHTGEPIAVASRDRGRRRAIAGLLLAAALIVIAYLGRQQFWLHPNPPARRMMLAVLPFSNLTGDPTQDYFADGFSEEMITQLGNLEPGRLGVIARTSAMQFKNTQKLVDQIGRELGVDYLLEGSVRRTGDRVRISAQLIRVRDQTHLWAADYDRDDRDILALQTDVAKAIGRQIELKLTPGQLARFADKRQVNPECYDLYLKGRYYLSKRTEEGIEKAVEYFRQAIEKDPNYARAYAGLADSYSFLGDTTYGVRSPRETMPKAKAAAMKALELDETLAEAHTSLAAIQETFEWEWSSAEKEYKRAIELNPGYATAHHWYAVYLAQMGRLDESIAEMRRAEEDDPLSPIISENTGLMFYFARHYDQAIEQYRKAFELDPNLVIAHYDLGRAYARKGLYDEAIAEFQKAVKLSGGQPLYVAGLASAYGVAGRKAQAIKIVKELKDRSKLEYVSPYEIALVYVSLGETNHAFEWLEKAYQERSSFKDELRAAPELDGLRSDPRFDDLLKRMRLPQ